MDFKYSKNEKLKSQKTIDLLFSKGQTISKYPLRLVYVEQNFNLKQNIKFQVGVSVSKRNFKKAVDRNYFKRLLRETYRLNKHLLLEKIEKSYSIMFFYQTKDRLTYQEVNTKTILLFEKFIAETQKTIDS